MRSAAVKASKSHGANHVPALAPSQAIPVIDDLRLAELDRRIRPIQRYVEIGEDLVHFDPDLHATKPTTRYYVDVGGLDARKWMFTFRATPAEPVSGLVEIRRIQTWHPSIQTLHPTRLFCGATRAEVLAQIPHNLLADTVAYETIDPGFNKKPFVTRFGKDFVQLDTILFGRKA